jgi:hypothetical protein
MRRSESEYIEGLLAVKVEAFLSGLSPSDLLTILERSLVKRLAEFIDSVSVLSEPGMEAKPLSFNVTIHNLSGSEAAALLERCFQACGEKTASPPRFSPTLAGTDGNVTSNHRYPAVILDAGIAVIRASVKDSVDILLEDKRAELTGALLEGRI